MQTDADTTWIDAELDAIARDIRPAAPDCRYPTVAALWFEATDRLEYIRDQRDTDAPWRLDMADRMTRRTVADVETMRAMLTRSEAKAMQEGAP